MEFLVQPMVYSKDGDCPKYFCYYLDPCPSEWCDNYCGDYDPCPGYSCGAYSTRSIGE